jgi:hypothetical protein
MISLFIGRFYKGWNIRIVVVLNICIKLSSFVKRIEYRPGNSHGRALTLGIAEKDALEIYVDKEKIILKKYEPACIFCGNADNITHFRGKNICQECARAMSIEAG